MNLASTLELYANRKLHYRTAFQGLPISVENRKGSIRRGSDKRWGKWSTKMAVPYGYIRGTTGHDGDAVDVFLGSDYNAKFAYIVHVNKQPDFKTYDEDKVLLGFSSAAQAKACFMQHYNDSRFFGGMDQVPMEEFKKKVLATKGKPQKLDGKKLEGAIEFERMMAGGPGSGRRPYKGEDSVDDLFEEHDRIKEHKFRDTNNPAEQERMYKMQSKALPALRDRIVSSFGEDYFTKTAKEELEKAESYFRRGDLDKATARQEMALIALHGRIEKQWKKENPDIEAGGPGSGCHGPDCGRKSSGVSPAPKNPIKEMGPGMAAIQKPDGGYDVAPAWNHLNMINKAGFEGYSHFFRSGGIRIEVDRYNQGEIELGKDDKETIEKAIKIVHELPVLKMQFDFHTIKGDGQKPDAFDVSGTESEIVNGIRKWWNSRHKEEELSADAGEPNVYDGGYGHIEPDTSKTSPPSLKKPYNVPSPTDPRETDDKFGDVTKRNSAATKQRRDQLTKQHTDANMRPLNTTLVQGFPSGTIGGFG